MNISYNYFILDPRKPGNFYYENVNFCFLYEPIYVGKASKYNCGKSKQRKFHHLYPSSLKHSNLKNNKLKKILQLFDKNILRTFIWQCNQNISEQDSLEYEIHFIKTIGRIQYNTGPLCNHSDGGEGAGKGLLNSWNKGKTYKEIYGKNYIHPLTNITGKEKWGEQWIDPKKGITNKMRFGETYTKPSKGKTFKQLFGDTYIHPNKGKQKSEIMGKEKAQELINAMRDRMKGCKHFNFGKHENATNAKEWIFISPTDQLFRIKGTFYVFCKEHNLSTYSIKKWINKGKIQSITSKTNGWEVIRK